MAGTLSSLGLGSSGALSADTIDKLKANDEKLQIDPIKAKIESISQKNQAYDLISSLMSSLSASTGSLGTDLLYLDRSTSATGSAASVTASSGVSAQNFSIEVTDLATKEIQESDSYSSEAATIATIDGTFQISIGTASFDFDVTTTTTLEELAQMINDKAGDSVKAQVLNVAEGDYRLILTSQNTGADQTINVADTSGLLTQNLTQSTPIQAGSDAHFKYNGIDFIRSSNAVNDIISGVNITLNEAGTSNISISQDANKIIEEMKGFVTAYNTLSKEINNSLTSDIDKGSIGVFNGDNTLKTLAREIKNTLFSSNTNGDSLVSYFSTVNSSGITQSAFELTRDGTLVFNESVFTSKFNEDPSAAESFLKYSSDADGNQIDGVFYRLDSFLDKQLGYNGSFTAFGDNLNEQISDLEDEQIRAQELLDARYETMFLRFASYDRIIGGLEQQFSALSLQIEAAINAKK